MLDLTFSLYDLEYFLLVFTRVSCFVFIAPFFGMKGVPNNVKIGLSFFTSVLLYQTLSPTDVVIFDSILAYAIIITKEAVAGLLIGFAATICTSIVNFAGAVADMETGLSMATLMDPTTRENTSITGVFYQYVLMLMMIATGMYRYLMGALADTFVLIPVNGVVFHSDMLVQSMIQFMGDYIVIGFRIVIPIFCSILLLNAVLGILAKVAPQMNMFAVGMQLKILVGLSILMFTASVLPSTSDFIFQEIKKMMVNFVGAMQ